MWAGAHRQAHRLDVKLRFRAEPAGLHEDLAALQGGGGALCHAPRAPQPSHVVNSSSRVGEEE